MPVLVSALASVPAVFLGPWVVEPGRPSVVWSRGSPGSCLWVGWAVLFALAENRRAWLREHPWMTVIAAATVPAVLFALGPALVPRRRTGLSAPGAVSGTSAPPKVPNTGGTPGAPGPGDGEPPEPGPQSSPKRARRFSISRAPSLREVSTSR